MKKADLSKAFGILAVSSAMLASGYSQAQTATAIANSTTTRPSADSGNILNGEGTAANILVTDKVYEPRDKASAQSLVSPTSVFPTLPPCMVDKIKGGCAGKNPTSTEDILERLPALKRAIDAELKAPAHP
jgi:hypothetical protein